MESIIERRHRLLGTGPKLYYNLPFEPVSAKGVHVYDRNGNVYLDAYNNVPHVGHCHPHVAGAICKQSSLLNTHTRYLFESILDYAEKLISTTPDALDLCMFTCTGSEANDLAWRVARAWNDGDAAITTRHAYHGNTTFLDQIDGSSVKKGRQPPSWWATVPAPDPASGKAETADGAAYAATMRERVEVLQGRGHKPAAFFLDTFFCTDGVRLPPCGFMNEAIAFFRAAGGLVVADEVQAGLGRTGAWWGFERLGLVPDILTCGKPLGNGHPIGVVITRREIAERFFAKDRYFNTFAGNPVSSAAGIAVMEVMADEQLRDNARIVGGRLKEELLGLQKTHELVGEVRGEGLLLGVEIVADQATKEPAAQQAQFVIDELCRRGILVGLTGPDRRARNLLKIRPPLVFDPSNVDQLIGTLDAVLSAARSIDLGSASYSRP